MAQVDIYNRTFDFAKSVINLVNDLPKNQSSIVLLNQVLRSACSIGANLREAKRSRSKKEFISSFGISLKEAEETLYWLQLISETQLTKKDKYDKINQECDEIIKILSSIIQNTRKNSSEF